MWQKCCVVEISEWIVTTWLLPLPARGQSVEEVMRQASEHGRSEHGMREIPPELAERGRAAIRDERDVS